MKKTLTTFSAIVITMIATAVFCVTLVRAVAYDPDGSSTAVFVSSPNTVPGMQGTSTNQNLGPNNVDPAPPRTTTKNIPGDYPSRLVISSIGVDAHVQYVGITAAGNVGTPDNFTDVAWYEDGAVPGETGSAIIDGHVNNGLGLAGVFENLDQVKIGDIVSVIDENGTKLDFTVTSLANYFYKDVPVNNLFNESDGKILRIITCGGTYVPAYGTHNERLVVTAVLKQTS